MNDLEYQCAFSAAVRQSHCGTISDKKAQNVSNPSFGAGSNTISYGGGQRLDSSSIIPTTSRDGCNIDSTSTKDEPTIEDREYTFALAEAMKAAKIAEGKCSKRESIKGNKTRIRNLLRRNRSKDHSRKHTHHAPPLAAPPLAAWSPEVDLFERTTVLRDHPPIDQGNVDSVADQAAKQAARHAAYLRVLNKDKKLVSGSYKEAGIKNCFTIKPYVESSPPSNSLSCRDNHDSGDRSCLLIDTLQQPPPQTETETEQLHDDFCSLFMRQSSTNGQRAVNKQNFLSNTSGVSPVSSICSRDTSVNSTSNLLADLELGESCSTPSPSLSEAPASKPQQLINPFDTFGVAP